MRFNDREHAHVVSAYTDALVTRRREGGSEGPCESDTGLDDVLDLTRELSAIRIATPPNMRDRLWRQTQGPGALSPAPERHSWLRWLRLSHLRTAPALAAAVLVVVVWITFQMKAPNVSAAELLQASAAAETSRLARPGIIAHRAFTVETRRASAIVTRNRVEQWADPTARVLARRVFDERRRLVGAEWTHADGSRTVYAPGQTPKREPADQPKPLTAQSAWRWDVSAEAFTELVPGVDRVAARQVDDGYELSFGNGSGIVAEAKLTLDESRAPVSHRIVLRDAGQLIEVWATRDTAEAIEASLVARAVFEPDAVLLPPRAVVADAAPTRTPLREVKPMPPPVDLDRLELQLSYRLYRLSSCLAHAGELERRASRVQVSVSVTSESCRDQAQHELAGLAAMPGVSMDLSVAEASTVSPAPKASALPADADLASMPAYPALYEVYARQALRDPATRDVDAAVRPLIRDYVSRVRGRSARIVAAARELKRLSARWEPETLRRLGLDATSTWRVLVREQANVISQDAEALSVEMQAIVNAPDLVSEQRTELRTLTDVVRAIAELNRLVVSTDRALQAVLSASPAGSPPPPAPASGPIVDLVPLKRDLQALQDLAQRFADPWSLEP